MHRVDGIGGFFFKAEDAGALSRWYAEHLGVEPPPESYYVTSWWQQPGPTVFAPMAAESGHFGDAATSWSVNFRVADLDAMVDQLRGGGVEAEIDSDT